MSHMYNSLIKMAQYSLDTDAQQKVIHLQDVTGKPLSFGLMDLAAKVPTEEGDFMLCSFS